MLQNILFADTFIHINQLIDSGIKVNSVNFYMNSNPISDTSSTGMESLSATSDPSSPEYWESTCNYLGQYSGYKFLYIESATNVTTSEVVPGNVSSSFNWGTFLSKSATSVVNMYLGSVHQAVSIAQDTISNILGSITSPLSVTYGSASEGYIKTWVDGDIYSREVLIRDDNNRVAGYAYYPWASTEQTRLVQGVKSKAPISKRTSTTYNYEYNINYSSVKTKSTSGFYGGSSFYTSVIALYNNTSGYPCSPRAAMHRRCSRQIL